MANCTVKLPVPPFLYANSYLVQPNLNWTETDSCNFTNHPVVQVFFRGQITVNMPLLTLWVVCWV